jgi:hypothetical protein
MNDVQYFEAARALAQRMVTEGGADASQRIEHGFRVVTGRAPTKPELTVLAQNLAAQQKRYAAAPEEAKKAVTFGESKPAEKLDAAELAAYTMVANVLLNLDEAVTKN